MPLPPLDELGRPSGGPLNRRAEIWMKSKAWLEARNEKASGGVFDNTTA